ncbi:dual specificity phosphatase [Delphinella strobiligena]|nr:dual specificity phosphatase [Delphinella strobiligena]
MPSVEGSEEPYYPLDILPESDAPGKHITWKKHAETLGYQHNESISTSASGSADSSPISAVSTVGDSSATEMSPESSPESPMGKPFLSSFSVLKSPPDAPDHEKHLHSSAPAPEGHRPVTPGRRPRNLKNLAVNTSGAFHMSRAASTTSLPVASSLKDSLDVDVAPPSFSNPPSPPKRRPTNLGLTILTPSNTAALPQNVHVAVPPTPSLSRPNMLRHFQSSPSLPLHTSSKVINSTSAAVNEQANALQQLSLTQEPLKSDDSEPNFDIPLSKEEKPEAYPDGPICVYGPYLDLYLEPTAEQALSYDVIMNVASEVRNPFIGAPKDTDFGPEIVLDGGGGLRYAPRRAYLGAQPAIPHRDGLSPVFESSPTTPMATPLQTTFSHSKSSGIEGQVQGPEYIHVPWEHNTDIVPDLIRLVKLIDDRITNRKRVLIHCQCGVSRSATLVVAYVIYKNPTMSVQEAYDAVKRKSKWIGPNMNLIMQLQEFRTALMRPMARYTLSRGLSPISPSLPVGEWGRPGPHADAPAGSKSPPNTAPLPQGVLNSTIAVAEDLAAVCPGPSSAPSGFAWPSHNESVPPVLEDGNIESQDTAYVDPSGHVIPLVKVIEDPRSSSLKVSKSVKDRPHSWNLDSHIRHDSGRHISPLFSPRATEFAMAPLQPPKEFDSADDFGLMSPTTSGFSHAPLDRDSLLGTLGMGSAIQGVAPHGQNSLPKAENSSRALSGRKPPSLRPKLSAPSLREQQELQAMQSRIEVTLAQKANARRAELGNIEALMSPRAFEFTQNPFALSAEERDANGSVPESDDPRSPSHKGVAPITRNIFDVL